MEEKEYIFLCHSLAKATSAGVRLYHGDKCHYYYCVYPLIPDPAIIFLPELLDNNHCAGIITTPLYQFYGFLVIESDWRIIIGPTKIEQKDSRLLEEQLFLVGVTAEKREEYIRALFCAPMITAERIGWTIAFLATLMQRRAFSMEELYVNVRPTEHCYAVHQKEILQAAEFCEDTSDQELVKQSYEFEKLLLSYVEHGEPGKLQELFSALPNMKEGRMAQDTLRQIKNTCICAATLASRAAIAGGMDSHAAFRLSDLYIQKIELLHDIASLKKLRNDLFLDYAQQVQQIRYRITESKDNEESGIFLACADYVSKNIYNVIRVDELANALGYSRTYLCHQFKQHTGLTLSQYILQEKILEAQRMLEFTDKKLSEIATLFSFSSQSHFQTVFKRISKETPMSYRQRKKSCGVPLLPIGTEVADWRDWIGL